MPEIRDALSELNRLGLHLDPAANAAEEQARRVRLNTRTYPLYRVVGFQLLLLLVLLHNLAVFGDVGWRSFLWLTLAVEVYAVAAMVAVRRWFLAVPVVRGWDLADFFFLADLLLWAAVIGASGGTASWLFFLPLVRVSDHRGGPRVYTFAVAAPLTYLLVVLWAALTGDVAWGPELVKVALLATAALYIAFTGRHVASLAEQRAAALGVATDLLRKLRDRTERLDHANRARSDLLARVRDGLGAPLVEIVGFSQSLLRAVGQRGASEQDYLQRIHQQARWVLRILEDLPELPDVTSRWPKVSLAGILQEAVARESTRGPTPRAPRTPADVELPPGDVEIRTEPKQLGALVEHLLSAARHFGGTAPSLEVRLDAATSLPDAVEVVTPLRNGKGEGLGRGDLMNPFAAAVSGDQQEMGARFELSLARSLSEVLGYRLDLDSGAGRLRLTLRLR